ncbi:MAG: sigma-70 family RNA polymerase sigma factor [Chloroflexi bacterium]|nr:sigma-70 family RNA polymerase sigma factor [Chloroflexota bacterium]
MPERAPADADVEALVCRAQAGEIPAFNALVIRHQDAVYSLALRMLGGREAAEDATQEAFLRAYRRLDSFRGGNFRSWLFSIVANAARDELRRRRRRPQVSLDRAADDAGGERRAVEPPDPDPLPEARALQSEVRGALEQALRGLPPDWREVVLLVDVHGLAYDEAAAALGVPVGTVRSRLSRARAQLRSVLTPAGELADAAERLEG